MDPTLMQGVGLLALRVATGALYMVHGALKVKQPSRGQMRQMMGQLGIPGTLFDLVAVLELLGGLALILGFLVRVASVLFAVFMVGNLVLYATKLSKPPINRGYVGGWELDSLLLAIAILVALTGPGVFSVDRLVGLNL